ncbi:hypothetical protein D3C73_1378040 [compost metagenome]
MADASIGWSVADQVGAIDRRIFTGSEGILPTLKKPTDDMTKAGVPVNMHAVYRSAYSRGQFVSQ